MEHKSDVLLKEAFWMHASTATSKYQLVGDEKKSQDEPQELSVAH